MKARLTKGFTLLEIMIVITIISILLGIAIPNFMNSREKTKASSCCANLREINQAKEQFAMANSMRDGMPISSGNLMPYLKESVFPTCPSGGIYMVGLVGDDPTCSIGTTTTYPHVLISSQP
jgi:prepilin-type N-terminal cleavage/methylation domain-containing protein